MGSRSDNRCGTSSGPHRCDERAGHDGPCETTEQAPAWVGPALKPAHRARVSSPAHIVSLPPPEEAN